MVNRIAPAKILVNRGIDLNSIRHSREKFINGINAGLGALNFVLLAGLTYRFTRIMVGIYAVFALILAVSWLIARMQRASLLGNAALVSETNFPEIHYIRNCVVRVLDYPREFEVFVAVNSITEPQWLRSGGQRSLVLPASLVAAMIDRGQIGQLIWLLGRMIGLQATRAKYPLPLKWLRTLGRLNPVTLPVFNDYRRITHFSADRIGLALDLSLIDAAEAIKKTISGGSLAARMNFDQLEVQADKLHGSFFSWTKEIIAAKPLIARRYRDLLEHCQDKYPDLYADFELHRKYTDDLLPSYREVQEFSEGKEEERRILRDLGKLVYDLMSVTPPLNDADTISHEFLQLHRNRDAASELEGRINRLNAAKVEWEQTVSKIAASEQKRVNAQHALESSYKEIGRIAFHCLQPEIPQHVSLQKIFEKAMQYQVVMNDRECEITRLRATVGSVLDKSRRQMEIVALRNQNSSDAKRQQAATEAAGEEFWKTAADQFEHDDLEPIKLRITGLISELERRRIELDNLYAQKRDIEHRLEKEGLSTASHPEADVPVFVEQLKIQARAANALRPRLLENLGKAYWQHESHFRPETKGVIEQLSDLKKRIRAFEQEEA